MFNIQQSELFKGESDFQSKVLGAFGKQSKDFHCMEDRNLAQHRVRFLGFYLSDKTISASCNFKIQVVNIAIFFVLSSSIRSAAKLQTLVTR